MSTHPTFESHLGPVRKLLCALSVSLTQAPLAVAMVGVSAGQNSTTSLGRCNANFLVSIFLKQNVNFESTKIIPFLFIK